MIFTVPLQPDTLLANVRYMWIADGVAAAPQGPAGVDQPDVAFPLFVINTVPPAGAQELIVFDVNDSSVWNTGGYRVAFIADKLSLGTPTEPVVVVLAPTTPDQCTCYLVTRDNVGALKPAVTIKFQLVAAVGADSFDTRTLSVVSDDNALLQVALPKGETYRAWRGKGVPVQFVVPNQDQFALPQLLGTP